MPLLSQKTRKGLLSAAKLVLLSSTVLSIGFFSFTGALLLDTSIYVAIAAFFMGGLIEGQVSANNIGGSLLKLSSKNRLEEVIYHQQLTKLLQQDQEQDPGSLFLKDYAALLLYVQELEASHDHSRAKELKRAKKRLNQMFQHFKTFIQDGNTGDSFHDEFNTLNIDRDALKKEIRNKTWLGRFSWILNIGAGLGCGLFALQAARESLQALAQHFGFAITGTTLQGGIYGLAILAAISYTLLIHNTISNMIENETLQQWYKKIRLFYKRKDQENNLRYGLRLLGGTVVVSAILGLGIFATVATAGTWWYGVKKGAEMIPRIKQAADKLRSFVVTLMSITLLGFNLANAFKSAKELAEFSIRDKINKVKERIALYRAEENDAQFRYNFARHLIIFITTPFTLGSYLAHGASIGMIGDKLGNVSPRIVSGCNAANECLTDFHVIFPEDHKHSALKSSPELIQGHNHHDHDHGDLTGKFLKFVVLWPLYFLSAALDCYFSQKNTDPSAHKPRLSMKEAIHKSFFGLSPKVKVNEPMLSWPLIKWFKSEKTNQIKKPVYDLKKSDRRLPCTSRKGLLTQKSLFGKQISCANGTKTPHSHPSTRQPAHVNLEAVPASTLAY